LRAVLILLTVAVALGGGCDSDESPGAEEPSELERFVHGEGADFSARAKAFDSAWATLSEERLRTEWFASGAAEDLVEKLRSLGTEHGWTEGRPVASHVSNIAFDAEGRRRGRSTHSLGSHSAQLSVSWEQVEGGWRIVDLSVK
jgi:hypothetical protein